MKNKECEGNKVNTYSLKFVSMLNTTNTLYTVWSPDVNIETCFNLSFQFC